MRRLNRREALATFGTVSLGGLLAACGSDAASDATTAELKTSTSTSLADRFEDASTCTVTTELTEGPFYFDVDSIRSDITEDREGTPLRLGLRVLDAGSCEPLENAIVDIWHCDAVGTYSGVEAPFLRGAQATNQDGIVEFKTVYPGWYRGRTTHIHAKVYLDKQTVLTSQLFFADDLTETVYAREPYSSATGRDTFNENDGIFDESLVMTSSRDGDGVLSLLTFNVRRA